LVFVNDVNKVGGRINTTKKNTEVLVVAVKKNGPDVNVEKTYVAISRPAGGKTLQHKGR
jgi:hypothetical protein